MIRKIIYSIALLYAVLLTGCAMGPQGFFALGNEKIKKYDCQSSADYQKAAEMELEDEGDWYPIYMLSLGLSRYYCSDYDGALKAFGVLDQYAVLRSDRGAAEKTFEFLKSKGNRSYELTEREETLLHFYMGMINFKKAQFEDAMVEFKKVDYIADGVYSSLPLVALMRGLTYEKLNDKGNALVAYKKVAEQNKLSPVGFMLAYRLEIAEGNKKYWATELKNKFDIDVQSIPFNKKEIFTIVECANGLPSNYKFNITYNQIVNRAYLLDAVNPDFSFGDFASGVLKEVGSKLARDLVKQGAASLIPGGGLIAGLFLGGDKAENRAWMNLPEIFIVDIAYLDEGAYNVKVQYLEDNSVEKEKVTSLDTNSNIVFVTNF